MVHYIRRIQFTTTTLNLTFLGSQIRLVCFFTFFFFILCVLLAPSSTGLCCRSKFLKDMEKERAGILCYLVIQLALCSQS